MITLYYIALNMESFYRGEEYNLIAVLIFIDCECLEHDK